MTHTKRRHPDRDRGSSAVEYGLMIAAIAATIVGTVFAVGQLAGNAFSATCDAAASSGPLDVQCGGVDQPAPPAGP